MDMDAMEELSGSNDQTMIIKGKRTKRRRQLSPAGMAVNSCSSGGGNGGDHHKYPLVPSSSTSSSNQMSTSTKEDEDMANCLMLLAQGGGGNCSIINQEEELEGEINMEGIIISSKNFNEMVTKTSTTTKVGFFVYECKTCNRTFPSFQALGGHRASHKKPKTMVDQEEGEDHGGQFSQHQIMELSNKATLVHGNNNNNNKSNKIHECLICGSEFSSGQALGGHMRRHRNPTTTKVTISDQIEKPRIIFPLDLNLPAPPEDDQRPDIKFQFVATNKQHLVFSAPALVDCHY